MGPGTAKLKAGLLSEPWICFGIVEVLSMRMAGAVAPKQMILNLGVVSREDVLAAVTVENPLANLLTLQVIQTPFLPHALAENLAARATMMQISQSDDAYEIMAELADVIARADEL